jgi:hypothetical protein
MRGSVLVPAALVAVLGCGKPSPAPSAQRVELVQKGPAQVELVPAAGQPPYCLVFTVAEGGRPIRHLTALEDKLSPDCPSGQPIAGNVFRIPPREGKVKIYVIFSDRALEVDSISRQIDDLVSQEQPITAMDLRAPGRVVVETLEFSPSTAS